MFRTLRSPGVLLTTLLAAGILAITMGTRQSLGLFVSPLNSATGLGIATISFAMAIGQFSWGAIQPVAGAVADRYGARPVLLAAVVLLALGCAVTPFMDSGFGLVVAIGLLTQLGAGAASFSVLIGAAARRLPAEARGSASGVINAGGSFGQFLFAPIVQKLIQSLGWASAMGALAVMALAALPMVARLTRPVAVPPAPHAEADVGLLRTLRSAMGDRSYLLLHLGFFTCGFHIAFLVTHLPGEVGLCGLAATVSAASLAIIGLSNIVGSLGAGWLSQKHSMKMILFWMYASRAVAVGIYLMLPKEPWTFYAFSVVLGLTWLATVPPTAGLVAKLFGVRYLATLFGFTLLSHQIGGFFGAWLGGLALAGTGSYDWMWYADIVLALIAAVANLPIREAPPKLVAA
jgi:predicted MFS family arabinose efflux permease